MLKPGSRKEKMDYNFETPMMQQYMKVKEEHPDCIVFFRLGDFYEMFLDDAKIGSEILGITLTARSRGKDGHIPMAGVPYHAVESYLSKLVRSGFKVAICEQLTEPDAGNLVERDVVRIVTPGTLLDERSLEKKQNNYIIGLDYLDGNLAFAAADLSTGDFQVTEIKVSQIENALLNELSRFSPAEAILKDSLYNDPKILKLLKSQENLNIYPYLEWERFAEEGDHQIKQHFSLKSLAGMGIEKNSLSTQAAAALLGYLKHTQKDRISHIKKINFYQPDEYVVLDKSTIRNLEIFSTIRDKEKRGSLVNALDKTRTSMGGRLLRSWFVKPLYDEQAILSRLEVVEFFLNSPALREGIREDFREIADIERIASRLATGLGNARDFIALKSSLLKIKQTKRRLKSTNIKLIHNFENSYTDNIENIIDLVNKTIVDEPPVDTKEGGIIKDNVNARLDVLRAKTGKSKSWITKLEKEEREKTGISSLKVKFNKVFGYYIEISKANLNLVPDSYMRKQTLVNAERFITPELKEHETIILEASEEINRIEYEIFTETVDYILSFVEELQTLSQMLATIDVLVSFAELAEKNRYTKPEFISSNKIEIIEGRHPVVEQLLETSEFVPNDVTLNAKDQQLLIITGPNMAGKSVFLRQVALIVLMAQIGCYVPAKSAKLRLVDRIFVRSGASDVISSGLSTFMVEMVETAYILNNATENSLIIMDEIGRGTSTYDGISIAWAVAEYIISHSKAKTLFATHYHELQSLEDKFKQIKNYQVCVEESKGELIFLHRVLPGGASHSHGVAVASLAGVPEQVTKNAIEILKNLEKRSVKNGYTKKIKNNSYTEEKLKKTDIEKLTPLQALNLLAELKDSLK